MWRQLQASQFFPEMIGSVTTDFDEIEYKFSLELGAVRSGTLERD